MTDCHELWPFLGGMLAGWFLSEILSAVGKKVMAWFEWRGWLD